MLHFPSCPQRSLLHAIARESAQNPPMAPQLAHNKALWSSHMLSLCRPSYCLSPLQPHPPLCFFLSTASILLSQGLCTFNSLYLECHASQYTYGSPSHLIQFSAWLCPLWRCLNTPPKIPHLITLYIFTVFCFSSLHLSLCDNILYMKMFASLLSVSPGTEAPWEQGTCLFTALSSSSLKHEWYMANVQ